MLVFFSSEKYSMNAVILICSSYEEVAFQKFEWTGTRVQMEFQPSCSTLILSRVIGRAGESVECWYEMISESSQRRLFVPYRFLGYSSK